MESYLKVVKESEHLKSYLFTEGAPESEIFLDSTGYLWGLKGISLYRFNGREWQNMDRFLEAEDIRKDKKLLSTSGRQIVVAVQDGFYRWQGHGFIKQLLPVHEEIADVFLSKDLIVDGAKVIHLGTQGYSVLDEKGLQYYAHSNLPYRISRLFSENEEVENLLRLVDSQNRLWSLRYPGARANRADWEAQLTSGLFFKMHDNALQDSLLIMDPQAFAAGFDQINSVLFQAIADDAVIAFPGSNRLIHIDLKGCKSKEIVLNNNARIRSMHRSADLNMHIVVYTIDKILFLQQYTNTNGSFVRNNEFRMVMDKDFDDYKGVFLNFRDEVYKVKLEQSWTNNDNDYFFANVSVLNSIRVSNMPFFGDRNNDKNAVVKHSGWVLAVINKDNASSTVNVTLNDMRLGTTVSYRLPLLDATNPDITYSNEHFVLFKGTGRLWYLDLRKLISVDLNDALIPGVRGSCYLKVEQSIPRMLTANILNSHIYKLYTEGNDGRYDLSATLPGFYTSIGVSNGLWYYHKRSGLSSTIQALPINKGRESSLCEIEGNFRAWLSGNGLFVANGDSLSLFEGTKKIFSSNEGVFAQSLSSWFDGHRHLLQYFMKSPAWAYSDGVLWHSRYAYYDPSSKDKEPVVVPSFSFNIKDQKMQVHPNLLSIHNLEGKVWALEVKADDKDVLYLTRLDKQNKSSRLPEQLFFDPLLEDGLRLFPGADLPIVTLGDVIWNYSKDRWGMINPSSYENIGSLKKVFYHEHNIWIVGYLGVCCYSPISQMGFVFRESDGLPSTVLEVWGSNNRVLVHGWDDHLDESKLISINGVSSGVRISVPWFEVESQRFSVLDYHRLKHNQNNIRIPIDILNVSDPTKCGIKYRLQGYDMDFQTRAYTPYLEFRKLKPGRYSLDVSAYSPEGYYSEGKKLIAFRIVPPLWANTYAYMLYVLLIAGSIYALFRYRTRTLASQKLALEKTVAERTSELREKQESMMQSIEYASLIQSSILPLESELRQLIPRHFIIFRPRDGVSGDFYWLHQEEGHFYLALIDCTGHGVPGALIAVTVNSILNSLVKDRGIKEPKDILTLAHQEIGRLLHQQSSYNQQDGFEIALLRVEPDPRKICFAGAKRPLYMYSEDRMLKIPANRSAIGGLKWHEKLLFTSTTFSYRPQTRLYLFSDGIVDQPHPAFGRKLGSARWLELLSENATMPIAEQEHSINNLLQQMLEYSDQRDDITIIGLELP
ncbi:MAG: SpoIIE family protein phosphatase [Candidatus Cloacimonetes bacterium]|nr:SpoIIE family protein phosphatase [Candidatus Cloacimonadota bacterium]